MSYTVMCIFFFCIVHFVLFIDLSCNNVNLYSCKFIIMRCSRNCAFIPFFVWRNRSLTGLSGCKFRILGDVILKILNAAHRISVFYKPEFTVIRKKCFLSQGEEEIMRPKNESVFCSCKGATINYYRVQV